jgi:hypothetical protein
MITCRDINNDNNYEWDFNDVEHCKFGCQLSFYDYGTNATCIQQEPEFAGIPASKFAEWTGVIGFAMGNAFPDIESRFFVFILLSIGIGGYLAYKDKIQLGIISSIMIILLGTVIGWIPYYVIVIAGVFGFIIWNKGEGEKE